MSKLITKDSLTTYMGGTTLNNGVAQQVVDAINDWVEERTNRCWGEVKTITERYDFGKTLWLRKMDIVSIASIKAGWPGQTQAVLDPSGYYNNGYGRVTMFWQNRGASRSSYDNDFYEVTYTYGVTLPPQDLVLAALAIAANFYNYAINGQHDIVASSVGSYRLEFAGAVRSASGAPDPAKSTDDANWQIIDMHRQRRV